MNPRPCVPLLCVAGTLSSLTGASAQSPDPRTPPGTLRVHYEYVGIKFADGTAEDCPDARRNGREVVTGQARLVDSDEFSATYEGTGQMEADIDGCGLTPNRADPGMWQGNEQPGGFRGDNFLGRVVTAVVPSHEVRLRVEVEMVEAGEPNTADIEWEPASRQPADAKVTTACEPSYGAGYIASLTKEYRGGGGLDVTDYDLLRRLVTPDARLREGTYEDPYAMADGRWRLTLGSGGPDITVAIEGPRCGCLHAEDAEGKLLRFTARASEPGGRFTLFQVRASATAPRVTTNAGGTSPRLELVPARRSGGLTLSIAYEKNGRRYSAPPFPVSICTVDSILVEGGLRDLTFDADAVGKLTAPVASRAWLDGADISSSLRWRLQPMPAPTKLAPLEAVGVSVTLSYEGLPRSNGAFGPKTVTVRAQGGACDCQREKEIRVFFAAEATNHPPGDGGTGADRTGDPNWFYYWMQTKGARSVDASRVRYRAVIPAVNDPNDRPIARYVWEDDRLFISRILGDRLPRPGGSGYPRPGRTNGRRHRLLRGDAPTRVAPPDRGAALVGILGGRLHSGARS